MTKEITNPADMLAMIDPTGGLRRAGLVRDTSGLDADTLHKLAEFDRAVALAAKLATREG